MKRIRASVIGGSLAASALSANALTMSDVDDFTPDLRFGPFFRKVYTETFDITPAGYDPEIHNIYSAGAWFRVWDLNFLNSESKHEPGLGVGDESVRASSDGARSRSPQRALKKVVNTLSQVVAGAPAAFFLKGVTGHCKLN